MRTVMLSVALAAGLFGFAGCQGSSNPNSPALQAMDNPPNACGPGGSSNSEDCDRGR
ncbi:hypothetical protein [Kaistia algarum]|uniref:hypothetical protein n=1 Tax=Kaistia algarum TaxID=2083279 RepID=UPI0014029F3F|nr:hypothetical protein [Kaistia algarum]MCX5514908.1 hypothetical protein [Kaistia algarum]